MCKMKKIAALLLCVLMLLSNFLYQIKYKLDEAEYARICKELQK